jgi:D-alanyl-D-alanine dipeptidase
MFKPTSYFLLIGISLGIFGCQSPNIDAPHSNQKGEKKEITPQVDTLTSNNQLDTTIASPIIGAICDWDTYLINEGLVDLQDIDSSIRVELKYSTTDNFMERDMYGCLENCYLQPDVAERLKLCQDELKSIDSNLTLLVYDGLRPRLVQQFMWDLLDMPINEKTKFVSNPANGSLHNFAAAVDITLFDLFTLQPLDMGTPYDYIGVLAWPSKEPSLLKDSLLTQAQVDNRILLRKVMKKGNFFNIQTEWWHFNACYRDKAKELYHIIEGDTSLIKI